MLGGGAGSPGSEIVVSDRPLTTPATLHSRLVEMVRPAGAGGSATSNATKAGADLSAMASSVPLLSPAEQPFRSRSSASSDSGIQAAWSFGVTIILQPEQIAIFYRIGVDCKRASSQTS